MDGAHLSGGLPDPARDGARAFRAILDAMARPGRIVTAGHARAPGCSPAAATALAVLCDPETPLHVAEPTEGLRNWIAFHCAAPLAPPGACAFALGRWEALGPLHVYPVGTPDYPDRSATLIVEMDALSEDGPTLSGPGIDGTARLSIPGPDALRANNALFPLGVDVILCAGDRLACLPRSTRIGGG